ncbi:MAG: Hpt domain-containing protein [Desulfovibrio sp.]|jgi:two-component system sensor histidine kinase/response regulator|nr:Hpt domain-containing protein [Desulfovibrio sp.]MDR3363086.1 Hpt domain-containing protein [Desulfovibrio sp.]
MSEEILDWQEAIARVLNKRDLYVKLLNKFIDSEKDSSSRVEQALKSGDTEEARKIVHTTKGAAANLGAKALAASALELETAIRAGGDTSVAMENFSSAVTDTVAAMSAFIAQ